MAIYYYEELLFQEIEDKIITSKIINPGMNWTLNAGYFIGTWGHSYLSISRGHFVDIFHFNIGLNKLFSFHHFLVFNNMRYSAFGYKGWFCCITMIIKLRQLIKCTLSGCGGAFNPSTHEAKTSTFLWVWDQPGLHNKFQNIQIFSQ